VAVLWSICAQPQAMRESQRPGEHSSSEGNATATVGGSTSGTTIQTAHLRRAMEKVGPSVLRGQGLEVSGPLTWPPIPRGLGASASWLVSPGVRSDYNSMG
jgi:hypothetical protein